VFNHPEHNTGCEKAWCSVVQSGAVCCIVVQPVQASTEVVEAEDNGSEATTRLKVKANLKMDLENCENAWRTFMRDRRKQDAKRGRYGAHQLLRSPIGLPTMRNQRCVKLSFSISLLDCLSLLLCLSFCLCFALSLVFF